MPATRAKRSAGASPRVRLPRVQREQRMLDAAERVFAARGYRHASMDEIAAGAGITKALLYQYFESKDGLYEACVERARAALMVELEATVAAAESPLARLRAFADVYFSHLDEHRGAWWLLYGEASVRAMDAMRQRSAATVARMLSDAAGAAGERIGPIDLELLTQFLIGAGEQLGRWWVANPRTPRTVVVDRYVAMAARAIGAAHARR